MLTVLLESRAARQRRAGSTVLSLVAHGAVVALVVALTLPDRSAARQTPDIRPTIVHFVPTSPTATKPSPAPQPPASRTDVSAPRPNLPVIEVPTITPSTIPPIDLSHPTLTSNQVLIGSRSSPFTSGIGEPGTPVEGARGVSDVSAVDRVPRLIGRAAEPRYPGALRSAGVQGHVLAEFVVDTLGHAELGTLRFPELTHALFGDAVREALAHYRFQPGEVAGRKVRTRVAVPFEFRLENSGR